MIRKLLADNAIEYATEADVTKIKEVFIAWFNIRATIYKFETANLALKSLKQGKNKNFCSY